MIGEGIVLEAKLSSEVISTAKNFRYDAVELYRSGYDVSLASKVWAQAFVLLHWVSQCAVFTLVPLVS